MPFSASIRLAQSSASLSGITSARDLPCQVSRRSHIYRQSSGIDAPPPDSHDFCPSCSKSQNLHKLLCVLTNSDKRRIFLGEFLPCILFKRKWPECHRLLRGRGFRLSERAGGGRRERPKMPLRSLGEVCHRM